MRDNPPAEPGADGRCDSCDDNHLFRRKHRHFGLKWKAASRWLCRVMLAMLETGETFRK